MICFLEYIFTSSDFANISSSALASCVYTFILHGLICVTDFLRHLKVLILILFLLII